jgi:hypothetical protein
MALVRGKVNPLNVLGIRKLDHIPPHFERLAINGIDIEDIDVWVYTNLDSRYCIKKGQKVDAQNKLIDTIELGLEDPKEMSMFLLGCPHLLK